MNQENLPARAEEIKSTITSTSGDVITVGFLEQSDFLIDIARENATDGAASWSKIPMIRTRGVGGATLVVGDKTLGTEKDLDEITCIVLYHHPNRSNYTEKYNPKADRKPPACSSRDGRTGYGAPGGSCPDCELSQWGPRVNGIAKPPKCASRRWVYVLRKDEAAPMKLNIAPTSLKHFDRFLEDCTRSVRPYYGVLTRVRCLAGEVIFEAVGVMDTQQCKFLRELRVPTVRIVDEWKKRAPFDEAPSEGKIRKAAEATKGAPRRDVERKEEVETDAAMEKARAELDEEKERARSDGGPNIPDEELPF